MGVARLVGARKVELPILMQQTDGLLHGMRRRPLPIHTLQVVGRPQPGTHRHGHPIRTRKAEDKHPRGMPRLAHPILIVVAVVAARQVDGAGLRRERLVDGEILVGLGAHQADRHPRGVKQRVVW
jgi:hypothetical protein